jgi:hypothetical protein
MTPFYIIIAETLKHGHEAVIDLINSGAVVEDCEWRMLADIDEMDLLSIIFNGGKVQGFFVSQWWKEYHNLEMLPHLRKALQPSQLSAFDEAVAMKDRLTMHAPYVPWPLVGSGLTSNVITNNVVSGAISSLQITGTLVTSGVSFRALPDDLPLNAVAGEVFNSNNGNSYIRTDIGWVSIGDRL